MSAIPRPDPGPNAEPRGDAVAEGGGSLYRAVFDAAEESMLVCDLDTGAIVDANARACERSGYARAELIGRTPAVLASGLPPCTEADALHHIARARQGESPRFEWQRRNKDGSLHWDEVCLQVVSLAGRPRLLASSLDITERKQVLEALRLREEQYRVVFEAASDAFVLRDGELRTIDANPAFYRLYGFDRAGIEAGGGYPSHLPADYVEERERQIRRALAGEATHAESIAYRADGSTFWIDLKVIPVSYRGQPHVLQVGRDITARVEAEAAREALEAQLRQAQKMEAIGQLTGGIAHDFNNILTSVMGYIVLATERAGPLGDARLQHQLEQAHLAAQRARDLIAQMLTFARRGRSERQALALAPALRQSLTLLRATLPGSIELETDFAELLPAVVADAVQVEQVLFNLCINARDAMNGEGRLRVGLQQRSRDAVCASCRQAVRGRWVELSVADEGPGVPAAVRERMFDPFYTTKEVGRGSGMGLAMVHGIVHEHGGHVVLDTDAGGSTFRVLLPLAEPGADAGAAPVEARAPASRPLLRGRLLLVEDEQMVGAFMSELLDGWGLDVTLCRDPLDALRRVEDDPQAFDLVLTDQAMPRMVGAELAQRLLALRPGLPVLLYTGFDEGLDVPALKALGVRSVLHKPVDRDLLLAALRASL
jgi:PAS domain S-box-containing protein